MVATETGKVGAGTPREQAQFCRLGWTLKRPIGVQSTLECAKKGHLLGDKARNWSPGARFVRSLSARERVPRPSLSVLVSQYVSHCQAWMPIPATCQSTDSQAAVPASGMRARTLN